MVPVRAPEEPRHEDGEERCRGADDLMERYRHELEGEVGEGDVECVEDAEEREGEFLTRCEMGWALIALGIGVGVRRVIR